MPESRRVRIEVNGVTYSSWDEVPAEQRAELERTGLFADADGDGTPDLVQGVMPKAGDGKGTVLSSTVEVSDVSAVSDWDELPPEVKATVRRLTDEELDGVMTGSGAADKGYRRALTLNILLGAAVVMLVVVLLLVVRG